MRLPRWCKAALLLLVIAAVVVLTTGFVYEQIGRARDVKNLPPRIGRAVTINGRSMNLYCSGEGAPTVVFEVGGNAPGYSWTPVQPKVARFTRACWYDRAGIGWSDSPPAPRTSTSVTGDLHELLRAAGEKPPYVLVGASVGGEYARVYTARFPDEVAGVVMVDSSHPDQHEPAFLLGPMNRLSARQRRLICAAAPIAARFGLLRLVLPGPRASTPPGFSSEQGHILRVLEAEPRSLLSDQPLVVLTAGQYFRPDDPILAKQADDFHQVWVHQLQASLARLSTRGQQIVVDNADHGIAYEAPDVVVKAVRDVVEQVRSSRP